MVVLNGRLRWTRGSHLETIVRLVLAAGKLRYGGVALVFQVLVNADGRGVVSVDCCSFQGHKEALLWSNWIFFLTCNDCDQFVLLLLRTLRIAFAAGVTGQPV